MNNQEGKIWYGVGIDTTGMASGAKEASNIFKSIGNEAEKQSERIDLSFKKMFAVIGGTAAVTGFIKQLVNVRSEFQQLEIAFTTMLKSKEKADALMMDITDFAAKTPFDLKQVAGGTKQLLAYGFAAEDMKTNLSMLGNVAAGVGSQIGDLIYLYGTLKASGRVATVDLNQFAGRGIPIYDALAESLGIAKEQVREFVGAGKVGFEDVEKAFQLMTGEAGMFYNLMEEQSKSIGGQISNLGDSIDAVFNEIGQQTEGIISDSIAGIAFLVEHYETVGKVIAGLVATYGTYKAAVIVINAINSLNAKIAYQQMLANIGNTGATIKLTTAQGIQAIVTSKLTGVQLALNKAIQAHPYVYAAIAVMGLVGALAAYSNSAKKAISEKEILNSLDVEAQKSTSQEISRINSLKKILNDSNKSYEERNVALNKLKEIAPDYHATLTTEGTLINNNADALDNYVKKLVVAEKIKIAASKQSAADEEFNKFKEENKDVLKNAMKKQMNGEQLFAGEAAAMEIWTRLANESENYTKVIEGLQDELVSAEAKVTVNAKNKTPEQIAAEKKAYEDAKKAKEKALEEYSKLQLDEQKNLYDYELELLRSKISDKKDLIDLEYEQTINAINKNEAEYKAVALKAGIKDPDLSVFKSQRDVASQKRVSDKKAIDDEELKNALEEYKTLLQKKEELENDYNKKRTLLSGNPQALKALTDSYRKELDSLQGELLDNNGKGLLDLYLFGNGEDFIQDKIKMAFPEIKSLSEATFSQLEQVKGFVDSIEFTPEQLKSFEELGIDVQKLLDNLKKAKSEETDFIDTEKWADILDLANQIAGAVGQLGDSLQGFGGAVGEIGSALSGIAGQVGNVTSIFKEGATTGDIISGGVSGLSSLIGMVANQVQANKEAQSEWNAKIEEGKHQMALMRIEAEGYKEANLFGVENPYSRAIAGAKQYAQSTKELYNATKALENGQTQTGTKKVVDAGNVAAGVGSGAAIGAAVGSFIPVIGNLVGAGIGALVGGIVGLAATKTVPVFESLKSKYGEVVDSAGNLNQQLIADYDKLDEETKQLVDNWEEIKAKQEEAQEMMKQNFSDLAGDLGSSLSDALVDAFKNDKLYSAIDTFDAKMNDVISGIVSQLIFNSIFGQMFSDLESKFNESFSTGGDQNIVDELLWFNENYQKNLDAYNQAMEAANKEMKNSGLAGFENVEERIGATKGFAQASQDSISELNGRFTAVQGHTFRIAESVEMLRSNSGQALKHLAGIETNTARLEAVENGISAIKNGIETINLKGVKLQ